MTIKVEQDRGTYLYVNGDIPVDLPQNTFVSVNRDTPLKIYGVGYQPAKSIPEIPRWFLQKYGVSKFTVAEPFAGSGTTILEALRYGADALWLDYQPLSRLICRVKTNLFYTSEVLEIAAAILDKALAYKTAPGTVDFANKDFWFQKPVQEGLEILREQILTSPESVQPVLWLAFASTVRKTSDMNDGMILPAKRAHIEDIPQRTRYDVFKTFKSNTEKLVEAISEWQNVAGEKLHNAVELSAEDAKNLEGDWECDAIVTSPPYINAIDYVWATKFELHWLGMVKNDTDRLRLYSNEIGTERIPRQEIKELGRTGHHDLDCLIEDIFIGKEYKATKGQNQLRSRVVYQYFIDMKEHLRQSFQHIRRGGFYCFSIGDISRICGISIPVASILIDLAHEVGYRTNFQFHLLLKNRRLNVPRNVDWAGTIKHDTVVVLEKP